MNGTVTYQSKALVCLSHEDSTPKPLHIPTSVPHSVGYTIQEKDIETICVSGAQKELLRHHKEISNALD